MPSFQVIQPNGGELIQSGRDYTLRWSGTDTTQRVRLEYSINAGRTWIFLTDTARGGEYLWRNVPDTPSDSCLFRVLGLPGDSTLPVGRRLVQFSIKPTEQHISTSTTPLSNETVNFSPDGTKILVTTFGKPLYYPNGGVYYGWSEQYTEVRDGKTGALLYKLPTYSTNIPSLRFNDRWFGLGALGYYWNGNGNRQSQQLWSPDNTSLLSLLNDTTIGIFAAETGMLRRTLSIPRQGNSSQIVSMQWTGGGSEVLIMEQHRFFSSRTDGFGDTLRTVLLRLNAMSNALSGTPTQYNDVIFGGANLSWCNSQYWGSAYTYSTISNDGERMLRMEFDSAAGCSFRGYTVRSTRTGAILQTINGAPNNGILNGWGGRIWSPNDSLLMFTEGSPNFNVQGLTYFFYNSHTGNLVTKFVSPPYIRNSNDWGGNRWSSDSKWYLLEGVSSQIGDLSPQMFILNIEPGVIFTQLPNTFSRAFWNGVWGNHSSNNGLHSGQQASNVVWSPDNRFIASFLYKPPTTPRNDWQDTYTSTIGIWNSITGCLVQTIQLPFPDDTNALERRTFQGMPIQWSPDGKRLLLYSSVKSTNRTLVSGLLPYRGTAQDGTAIILSVNIDDVPCQQDVSNDFWTILPRGALTIENANFSTLQCGTTTETIRVSVGNLASRAITLFLPRISGTHADDFTLITNANTAPRGIQFITTTNGSSEAFTLPERGGRATFTIRFSPRSTGSFGARSATMALIDTSGTLQGTILLSGRNDTLAVQAATMPPSSDGTGNIRQNLGILLQSRSTTASVLFRNASTRPLVLGRTGLTADTAQSIQTQSGSGGSLGGGMNSGAQQFRSMAGRFWLDSISPRIVPAGGTARLHFTVLGTENTGVVRDSIQLLECAAARHLLVVEGRILPDEPRLEMDTLMNFGTLLCQASSEATVRLTNQGGKPLRINAMIFGDNPHFRAVSSALPFVIQPLDTVRFTARYTPFQSGTVQNLIIVDSDDPRPQQRIIRLRGNTTLYRYEWSTETVNFGRVGFGQAATRTLELKNTGGAPFLAPQFPRRLNDVFVWESMQPETLQPNSTATVTMRFTGQRSEGSIFTSLEIPMQDTCKTVTRLQFAASVLAPEPRLAVQDTVRLPRLFCEASTEAVIRFVNEGEAELRISGFRLEFPPSTVLDSTHFPRSTFQISTTTLAPQAASTLRFRYEPRTTGQHTATLIFQTNDVSRDASGEVRVTIVGNKDSVGMRTNTGSVQFSTVQESSELRDTVLLTNTGTVPLLWQAATNNSFQNIANLRIDSSFVLERVEPAVTPPSEQSRLVVRFLGNRAGFSAMRAIPLQAASLLAPNCIRSTNITLSAEVRKEARIAALQNVSTRLLCEYSTSISIALQSIGTDELRIDELSLEHPPTATFRIVHADRTIPARTGQGRITILAETPQLGTFTAMLRFRTNAVNLTNATILLTIRKDSSGIQALSPGLDFSPLAVNTPSTRIITIRNTGTLAQGFSLPVRVGAFLLDSLGMNPLPPGRQTEAWVRFQGSAGGMMRDTVRLFDSCGRGMAIPLQARIIAGLVALPDTIAHGVGEIREIPLFLRNAQGVEAGMDAAFSLRVQNAGMLDIIAPTPQKSSFENKGGTLSQLLEFRTTIASTQAGEPFVRLRARGLIGNATISTVQLERAFVSGVQVQTGVPAILRTRGINYAGGSPRLVFAPNLTAVSIAPQPAQDEIRMSLNLREAAFITVSATTMLGTTLVVHEGIQAAGSTTLRIPASNLASGIYFLQIRSGAEVYSTTLSLVR